MLHCQRDAFQLPADAHYVNCAFMSPLMHSVENAGVEGIRRKRNPADIRPADFFDEVNRVRGLFAQLIQAEDATRVAVVPSASYGLTAAARNLPMEAGQAVIVAAGQMPSNMYCWRRLAVERQGRAGSAQMARMGRARSAIPRAGLAVDQVAKIHRFQIARLIAGRI